MAQGAFRRVPGMASLGGRRFETIGELNGPRDKHDKAYPARTARPGMDLNQSRKKHIARLISRLARRALLFLQITRFS
jgi:hypothetical protein